MAGEIMITRGNTVIKGSINCIIQTYGRGATFEQELDYEIVEDLTHKPVQYEKADEGTQLVFKLLGGPTGFESFYINRATLRMMFKVGWLANSGNRLYQRCYISGMEMKRCLSMPEGELQ